jgi:diacylglycerol O-acyltransferase / wax synthase
MQPMTGGDAAWYRMDRSRNEGDVLALLSFTGAIDFARLQHVVEHKLLPVERFLDRPVPRWAGLPAWERDPGFALSRHLSRVQLAAGGLRDFLGEVATSTLDGAHPLWKLWLAEEAGGETALVAKVHHALGDGFALVALLLALADEKVEDAAPTPRCAPPERRPRTGAFPGAETLAAARDAASFGATFARLAALPYDPPDLSAVPLSGVRRVAWSGAVSLEAVHEAARAADATVNDLVVAAVAGAIRSRLVAEGKPISGRGLRAFVPVNFREGRPDVSVDPSLGNRFGLLYVPLPVDLASPRERLAAVREEIARLRSQDDAIVAHDVLAACGWAPTALHHALTTFFSRKTSLVLTNLAGPASRLHIAGRSLARLVFWVPHPCNLGLGVSVMSYAGEIRFGVRADVAVVADPGDVVARIGDELTVLGVGGGDATRPAASAS